jgi:hypothetical protein
MNRQCFDCNGTGQKCNVCGEAVNVCEHNDPFDCEECSGTGIASADRDEWPEEFKRG